VLLSWSGPGDSPAVVELVKRLRRRLDKPAFEPVPVVKDEAASKPPVPPGLRVLRKKDDAEDEFGMLVGQKQQKRKGKQAVDEPAVTEEVTRAPPGFLSGVTVKYVHSSDAGSKPSLRPDADEESVPPDAASVAATVRTSGSIADPGRHCTCEGTLHKMARASFLRLINCSSSSCRYCCCCRGLRSCVIVCRVGRSCVSWRLGTRARSVARCCPSPAWEKRRFQT
jgi:hypothetical protein